MEYYEITIKHFKKNENYEEEIKKSNLYRNYSDGGIIEYFGRDVLKMDISEAQFDAIKKACLEVSK